MNSRLILAVALFAFSGTADAHGSLRCKGKIIRTGVTLSQVLSLCGEPESRVVERVPVRSATVRGYSRLSGVAFAEYLEYDRGWGKFPAVLTFRDGILRRVDYLSYRAGKR